MSDEESNIDPVCVCVQIYPGTSNVRFTHTLSSIILVPRQCSSVGAILVLVLVVIWWQTGILYYLSRRLTLARLPIAKV
jgi:hypothetical protein